MSVVSSLSYRKQSNLDSTGGKGDALFSALKENVESEDDLNFRKAKPRTLDHQDDTCSVSSKRKSQAGEDMNDRESVISLTYSEVNCQSKKGVDSRWADFDKDSTILVTAPTRASTRLESSPIDDAKSNISIGLSSPLGYHQSTSQLYEAKRGKSLCGSSPCSPCSSRRYGGISPGSVSHMLLARSSRLSKFDVDADDSRSVAFSEISGYSLQSSTGRSISMPPPQARSSTTGNDTDDNLDIKLVSHHNYLDPDLEKAINEVLRFKPIKFRRSNLQDTEDEQEKSRKNVDNNRNIQNGDRICPASSLRHSASAVNCSKSKGKSKKKKKSHSSQSNTSGDDRHYQSSSKRRSKKSRTMSKRRDQSSSSSSSSVSSYSKSESGSESSSDASTISYQSSSSVKKVPARKVSSPEGKSKAWSLSQPINKKDDNKRKKKVDSLMMKYLYRPDSD